MQHNFLQLKPFTQYKFSFHLVPITAGRTEAVWIPSLPKAFTHDRRFRESNPRPLDLGSSALTTLPRVLYGNLYMYLSICRQSECSSSVKNVDHQLISLLGPCIWKQRSTAGVISILHLGHDSYRLINLISLGCPRPGIVYQCRIVA